MSSARLIYRRKTMAVTFAETISIWGKGKGKAEHLYSAWHGKDHFKALRHGSHSFTCNKHHACLTS